MSLQKVFDFDFIQQKNPICFGVCDLKHEQNRMPRVIDVCPRGVSRRGSRCLREKQKAPEDTLPTCPRPACDQRGKKNPINHFPIAPNFFWNPNFDLLFRFIFHSEKFTPSFNGIIRTSFLKTSTYLTSLSGIFLPRHGDK